MFKHHIEIWKCNSLKCPNLFKTKLMTCDYVYNSCQLSKMYDVFASSIRAQDWMREYPIASQTTSYFGISVIRNCIVHDFYITSGSVPTHLVGAKLLGGSGTLQ